MFLPSAFIEGIGGPELMMIMFIILLLFGANRLPELAKGLGKSVREFKKAASGVEEEVRKVMEGHDDEPQPKKFPPYPPATPAVSPTSSTPPPAPVQPTPPPKSGD